MAWIALSPLLLALRSASIKQAAGLAFLFGCLYGVGVFWWLNSVDGVGYLVYFLVLAPLFGFYYGIFGLFYRSVAVRFPTLCTLVTPALWVSIESARVNMSFLSLPWNLLGHTQHGSLAIVGISDLTGVYGVSFLLVMVNEVVSRWTEATLGWRQEGKAYRRGVLALPV